MGIIFKAAFAAGLFLTAAALPREGEAPKEGMLPGFWSSGVKQIYGTAYEPYGRSPRSPVWFTGSQGVLSEVFWPRADTAQVRDSQFLVTDGDSFFFEERQNSLTTVEWLETGVPAFRTINKDPEGRFEIEKLTYSDPERPVVLQRVKFTRRARGLRLFILHNPAVGNSALGDTAFASQGDAPGAGLYAWQGDQAQALIASLPFKQVSAGFEGTRNDGFQDLSQDYRLDSRFAWAKDGNVVLTAQLDIDEKRGPLEFDIALGFGKTAEAAREVAAATLARGAARALDRFRSAWRDYQSGIKDLSGGAGDGGQLFRQSIAVLKTMEDKQYPGAFIASPAVPWGLHQADKNADAFIKGGRRNLVSGYHIVWPRDLFHMATAFQAVGDYATAVASLSYLRSIQYRPEDGVWKYGPRVRAKDGSFPQNCWIDGDPHWGGLQLDEVALPILLTQRLWHADQVRLADYWDMVRRAADFLRDFGPWSPQERWEEIFGITPSTMAAEIAGLRAAAEIAAAMGDASRASAYRNTAQQWTLSLESWLFTTSGRLGNGRYFERVEGAAAFEQRWDPNDNAVFEMANKSGLFREKDVVDGGFLELVRHGVLPALNPAILDTLPEYDSAIRVDFAGGVVSFRRYLGDRYNYDETTNEQTLGMPWPILTGERGHYELARALEQKLPPFSLDAVLNPYLLSMESFATPQGMIPEQVWDYGVRAGTPTGAATPLGWAHAEYIKLLRSKLDRKVF